MHVSVWQGACVYTRSGEVYVHEALDEPGGCLLGQLKALMHTQAQWIQTKAVAANNQRAGAQGKGNDAFSKTHELFRMSSKRD